MPARVPMTAKQRAALLALPDTEDAVVRHHTLSTTDLAAVATARTDETRLGYALQLCCLRFPGRYLRRGELLPAIMLDHVAEQVGVNPDALARFARRAPTRYEQVVAIKRRHGFHDPNLPLRAELRAFADERAIGTADARQLLSDLIEHMRERRIVIPGVTVVERMAAEAMHRADGRVADGIAAMLTAGQRAALDALLSDKEHGRQSRLSWLRAPAPKVGGAALAELLDKLDVVRDIGATELALPPAYGARLRQMAREGVRLTAQAFAQMGAKRRHAMLVATLRENETTLTDAALAMFQALVARANLRARKRLEAAIAASAEDGRARPVRIAQVLEAATAAARRGADIAAAMAGVAPLAVIEADAALIRRSTGAGKPDVLGELAPEYRVFKRVGHRLLAAFRWSGPHASRPLLDAIALLADLAGDHRRPLPPDASLLHVERRWRAHVARDGKIDRAYFELATYFALDAALASGAVWVASSRTHRSLDDMLSGPTVASAVPAAAHPPAVLSGNTISADAWLSRARAELDAALLAAAREPGDAVPVRAAGDRLRFPAMPADRAGDDTGTQRFAARLYSAMPTTRITDVLSEVARWTGFVEHFAHVSTGLPPADDERRAFLAALIAEATNLGLSRMADVCGVASRRALLRMQTWHMRDETFRVALACLTDAIHAEPVAAWFGDAWRASADGQHFPLGGQGEAGGRVNAHYGRDPIVKIHTTITGRYAPLHQTVIAGTAGEAVHALDGILGHESSTTVEALHVDGGGVSDIVFALTHLLGVGFEPRIPRLSGRRLYAFEPRARYGRLAPLFGQRLDGGVIAAHWHDIMRVRDALAARTATPSLILRKLSASRQQNGLAAALREMGRVQRTLFTLRWLADPALRQLVTAELNKGEARNSLARAVAFHRLGRFRDRGHENQGVRAAALTLVTAAIALWNCRYLGRALDAARARGTSIDDRALAQLSPLGWDHINLTGDYVWSDDLNLDADGFMPPRATPT